MSHDEYETIEDVRSADVADVADVAETEEEFQVELPEMSYAQLEQLKEAAITKQREQREKERDADINTIKVLVARHDLKWRDIRVAKTVATKVAPKYRDPVSGVTWTGRGRAPLWIRDAEDRDAFLI